MVSPLQNRLGIQEWAALLLARDPACTGEQLIAFKGVESMGVDVHLETERGERLKSVPDARKLLKHLVEAESDRLMLLRYVDVYGETICNYLQAPHLLEDLDTLRRVTEDPAVLGQLGRVEEVVREVMQQRHRYIRFSGD